jgi:hypothetical protein
MEKALDYIIRKFPDYGTSMIDLYSMDEDFRILCSDYLTSVETLEECRLKVLNDRTVENEYVRLSLDLEKEILYLLRKTNK